MAAKRIAPSIFAAVLRRNQAPAPGFPWAPGPGNTAQAFLRGGASAFQVFSSSS
jgi:hypothetical protein